MAKLTKYAAAFGSLGGKARAKKHSKAQLSAWGKAGGRPAKRTAAILALLEKGPLTRRQLATKLRRKPEWITMSLSYLRRNGLVEKSKDMPAVWSIKTPKEKQAA